MALIKVQTHSYPFGRICRKKKCDPNSGKSLYLFQDSDDDVIAEEEAAVQASALLNFLATDTRSIADQAGGRMG